MAYRIQLRGDDAAALTAANEVLLDREMCIETDTMLYKIGDGVTPWNALPYRQLVGEFANAILMDAVANPSAPAAGKMLLYAHNIAGRIVPKWIGPSGLDMPIQPELASNSNQIAMPGSSTALSYTGMGAMTAVGTVAHPAIVAGVNARSATTRATVTSAATANAASELRYTSPMCYRGEVFGGVPVGGFYFKTRFGISSTTAGQRCSVGLFNNTGATSTTLDPPAATNCIAVGWGTGDTNLQVFYNDATGTCSKINLGTDFPANNPAAIYELSLFCAPNGDEVGYRVVRLDTNVSTSGTLTTDLPPKSTMLTYHAYANNGGTAAAVVLDFIIMAMQKDT